MTIAERFFVRLGTVAYPHVAVGLIAIWFVVTVAGCGDQAIRTAGTERAGSAKAVVENAAGRGELSETSRPSPPDANAGRHIVYEARVDMIVEDYGTATTTIMDLAKRAGGFVASSNTDQRIRNRRSGRYVVRVPSSRYDHFLTGVRGLGYVQNLREDAEDVTEQYVDVEARLATNRKLESRLLHMLESRDGKLEELLNIERELARVRTEIERTEGRLRVLKDRVALATITVDLTEQVAFEPPQTPSFGGRISRQFSASWSLLGRAFETLVLLVVAMVPWLIVLALPVATAVWWLRRS